MLQFIANVRLSELQSDLVNYMRIVIEMFEKLNLAWLKHKILKKSLPCTTSYIIIHYFTSQIKLNFTAHVK